MSAEHYGNVRLPRNVMENEEPPSFKPEKELIRAMITRACLDLASPNFQERRAAYSWLLAKPDVLRPWSLYWVCNHLDIDAKAFLEKLQYCVHQVQNGNMEIIEFRERTGTRVGSVNMSNECRQLFQPVETSESAAA